MLLKGFSLLQFIEYHKRLILIQITVFIYYISNKVNIGIKGTNGTNGDSLLSDKFILLT